MNKDRSITLLLGIIFGGLGVLFLTLGGIFLLAFGFGDIWTGFLLSAIFDWIGLMFTVAGVICLVMHFHRKAKRERLMKEGFAYPAEILRSYKKMSVQIIYQNPFIFECIYQDPKEGAIPVTSGHVWISDESILNRLQATAYVNPENPKDYYVEMDIMNG